MGMIPEFQRQITPQAESTGPTIDLGTAQAPGRALAAFGQDALDALTKLHEQDDYNWLASNSTNFAEGQQDNLDAAKAQAAKTGDYKGAATSYLAQLDQDVQARAANAPDAHVASAFMLHSKGIRDAFHRQMVSFAGQGEFNTASNDALNRQNTYATLAYRNPDLADHYYGLALGDIKGMQAAGLGGPDVDWTQKVQQARLQIYGPVVRRQIDDDPTGALTDLKGGKFDRVLPPDAVESYTRQASNAVDRQAQQALVAQQRQLTAETRADALAQRQLRETQASTEAGVLADAASGKPVDPGKLTDLVRNQQITPGGYDAILRAQDGRDDPQATLHLYSRLGAGDLASEDIMAAVANRQISAKTGVELQRGLNEKTNSGDNQAARAGFDTLKTALDGKAAEDGSPDLFGAGRTQAAALWTQAQGEWTRRVVINHEDPQAALSDMIPRYAPKASLPTWLPAPQTGAITSPQDIGPAFLQMRARVAGGAMTQAQANQQAALLQQYQTFFDAKAKSDAAIKALRRPPAGGPAASPTGDQQ